MTYTIGEAAERCGVTAHTLRYYDKEGLLPYVERSTNGIRKFKEQDFEWLTVITCLKESGVPIKKIKEFVDWSMAGDLTIDNRLAFLKSHKKDVEQKMAELQKNMDLINYKIWYYEAAAQAGTTKIHEKVKGKK